MSEGNEASFKEFAGEGPVPLRVFFTYLYATWSLAVQEAHAAGGSPNETIHDKAREQMMVLCTSTPAITPYAPELVSFGYDETEHVLWFPRSKIIAGVSRQMFLPKRPFYADHVRPFFNNHAHEKSFDLSNLDEIDRQNVEEIAGKRLTRIANLGRVLLGAKKQGGFSVITIRHETDIDPPGVIDLLLDIDAKPRFVDVVLPSTDWWQEREPPPVPTNARSFEEFAHEVVTAFRSRADLLPPDTRVITVPVLAPISEDTDDALARTLQQYETITAKATLVVVMNAPTSAIRAAVLAAVRARLLSMRPVVLALGKEELQRALLAYPWLWSKYVDQEKKLWIIRDDDAQLRRALLREPLSAIDAVDFTRVLHPRLCDVTPNQQHIALTGRPGTGKSVALYQLARELRDRLLVVVESGVTDEAVVQLAVEVVELSPVPVTIIFDNLQRQADLPALKTVLGRVLDRAERRGVLSKVQLLTAHWNSHHERVVAQYASFPTNFAHPVSLDFADRAFLTDVALAVLQSSAERQPEQDETRQAAHAGELFARWDARPAGVVAYVVGGVDLANAEARRAHSFWALRFQGLGWEERGIIQILAGMRWFDTATLNTRVVRDYFRALGYPPERFDFTITRLVEKYWIVTDREKIECNDVQLSIGDVGLVANDQLTEATRRFNRAMMAQFSWMLVEERLELLEHILREQMNYREDPQYVRETMKAYKANLRKLQKSCNKDPRPYLLSPTVYLANLGLAEDLTRLIEAFAGDEATRAEDYYRLPAGMLARRGHDAAAQKLLLHALATATDPGALLLAAANGPLNSRLPGALLLSVGKHSCEEGIISSETLQALTETINLADIDREPT